MTTLFAHASFDTETTGLPLKDRPETADGQPRMASVSLVLASPTFSTQSERTFYIKPDGWKNPDGSLMTAMPPEAEAVHGLSFDFLMEHGVPVREALDAFTSAVMTGRVVSAFNIGFDVRIMRAELERAGMDPLVELTRTLCTMKRSIGIVKLPIDGRRYKVPKLSEALEHFKLPQYGAHTSIGDAISSLKLLHAMSRIGIRLEPELIKARVFKAPKMEFDFGEEKTNDQSVQRKAPRRRSAGSNWLRPGEETSE